MLEPFYFGEQREKIAQNFIRVDDWVSEDPQDQIYITTRGSLWLPVANMYGIDVVKDPSKQALNAFVLSSKRCYNGAIMREHIPHYLNYFEKFYDTDRELLCVTCNCKILIDTTKNYTKEQFIRDVNRYILSPSLCAKARMMNEDNYNLDLDSKHYKHDKNAALIYKDRHAKMLMWISLMMNMCIPLITHYIHINKILDPNTFILDVFDNIFMLCPVNIYNKLCETSYSNVAKNSNRHEVLWNKQDIRGKNVITHALESVNNIILNIMPKYNYRDNIIFFNYTSINKNTYFQVTGIEYEYNYVPLNSAIRDCDNNSNFDKFESYLTKTDEALYLQNKVACEETMKSIELMYGPFSAEEIDFYTKRLMSDNGSVINEFQKGLVFNLFYKYFGDPQTINSINRNDYIKLVISAKRLLIAHNMVVLPYIISGKLERLQNKKTINKREQLRLEKSPYYEEINEKYNNEKIILYILSLIGTILASKFQIVDYDIKEIDGKILDKEKVPDLICEEVQMYVTLI